MQYLLQAGPQGILRVWPTSVSGQTKYCSFMVSMTTTSAQVVRMVLEKYDVVADPLRYYLCQVGHGKGGQYPSSISHYSVFISLFPMSQHLSSIVLCFSLVVRLSLHFFYFSIFFFDVSITTSLF